MENDKTLQEQVVKLFGQEMLTQDQKIDREKLGKVIFANKEKWQLLNKLTHPRITKGMLYELFNLKILQNKKLVVIDAPLLYETRLLEWFCYPILVVYTDDSRLQQRRLMTRNNFTEEESENRIQSQMPLAIKIQKADIALDNSGSLKDLQKNLFSKIIPVIYQKLGYFEIAWKYN